MKKTLTVNLGGTVFQIDEDAYNLLDNYLTNLRLHFQEEEGVEEIVRDMEMRISELFTEALEGGQQVITIDAVEKVIKQMGRPEELDDADAGTTETGTGTPSHESEKTEATGNSSETDNTQQGETTTGEETVRKRLFRDVDHKILGGVLSGIAAYFDWDPTALRLVYIFLGLLPGGPSVLLIYLILLFIIPAARTATEKLQMRGEPVNMENIGKTVTGEYDREEGIKPGRHRTGFQKFLDAVVSFIGILLMVFFFVVFICCVPFLLIGFFVLFTIIMSVFGIFIHVPSIFMDLLPIMPWSDLSTAPGTSIFFLLSMLLIIGVPLMIPVIMILQHFGYCKPLSTPVKVSMLLVWFIALVSSFILFFVMSTF